MELSCLITKGCQCKRVIRASTNKAKNRITYYIHKVMIDFFLVRKTYGMQRLGILKILLYVPVCVLFRFTFGFKQRLVRNIRVIILWCAFLQSVLNS